MYISLRNLQLGYSILDAFWFISNILDLNLPLIRYLLLLNFVYSGKVSMPVTPVTTVVFSSAGCILKIEEGGGFTQVVSLSGRAANSGHV